MLVKPGCTKVIPLAPEFIAPQDGCEKQDCEINPSLRWLENRAGRHAGLGVTVLGDDLYCHEPFCRALPDKKLEFILVCKPDSHKTLYEWVDDLDRNGVVRTVERQRWTGKRHEIDTYRYVNAVPLRDTDEALMVNWCELAYLVHTLLDLMDDKFCLLRQKLPSRKRLFDDMKALTTYLLLSHWETASLDTPSLSAMAV